MSAASFERRFLDRDGRVKAWPSKLSDQKLVLEWLATHLEPEVRLSEGELNEWLRSLHGFGDWALLRRALVDHGFLQREADGSAYWRPAVTEGSEDIG